MAGSRQRRRPQSEHRLSAFMSRTFVLSTDLSAAERPKVAVLRRMSSCTKHYALKQGRGATTKPPINALSTPVQHFTTVCTYHSDLVYCRIQKHRWQYTLDDASGAAL